MKKVIDVCNMGQRKFSQVFFLLVIQNLSNYDSRYLFLKFLRGFEFRVSENIQMFVQKLYNEELFIRGIMVLVKYNKFYIYKDYYCWMIFRNLI